MTAPTGLVTESVETLAEVLGEHRWHTTLWGDGHGGYAWRCSCGVMDRGTEAENPARFARHATVEDAHRAGGAHVAAALIASGAVHPAAEVQAEALREVADAGEAFLGDETLMAWEYVRHRAALAAAEPDAGERS